LHDYNFTLPNKPFVGLDNYTGLIGGDSPFAATFWQAMQATWLFTVLAVPLLLVLPLLVALALNQTFRRP
jgi:multiple sugar transport system permease protein